MQTVTLNTFHFNIWFLFPEFTLCHLQSRQHLWWDIFHAIQSFNIKVYLLFLFFSFSWPSRKQISTQNPGNHLYEEGLLKHIPFLIKVKVLYCTVRIDPWFQFQTWLKITIYLQLSVQSCTMSFCCRPKKDDFPEGFCYNINFHAVPTYKLVVHILVKLNIRYWIKGCGTWQWGKSTAHISLQISISSTKFTEKRSQKSQGNLSYWSNFSSQMLTHLHCTKQQTSLRPPIPKAWASPVFLESGTHNPSTVHKL